MDYIRPRTKPINRRLRRHKSDCRKADTHRRSPLPPQCAPGGPYGACPDRGLSDIPSAFHGPAGAPLSGVAEKTSRHAICLSSRHLGDIRMKGKPVVVFSLLAAAALPKKGETSPLSRKGAPSFCREKRPLSVVRRMRGHFSLASGAADACAGFLRPEGRPPCPRAGQMPGHSPRHAAVLFHREPRC